MGHAPVGDDLHVAGGHLGEDLPLERVGEPGLGAERERGPDLHAGRPGRQREAQPLRGAVGAGQPERQPQPGHDGEVDLITDVVDGLSELVDATRPARRRVVPAGAGAFHDEAVRAGRGAGGQAGGQVLGGDDGHEPRPAQRRQPGAEQLPRAAPHRDVGVGRGRPLGPDGEDDVVVAGQAA